MFIRTTAINKLLKLKKRVRVVPGSTSAGKTFGILPVLINDAILEPGLEISVVSESMPHLRRGAMKDFLKIMALTKRFQRKQWNASNSKYTFLNGSYIEFFSADMPSKVLGPRRHILFINEANNIAWETYHQLAIRTSNTIWVDFNPANESWAYEELKNDDDIEWLTLTYKDNEALAPALVREIEKALPKAFYNFKLPTDKLFSPENIKNAYWSNWWKVYGLGQLGMLQGVVFSNWKIIDELPKDARLNGTGIDFGYSNHPTAIINQYMHNNSPIYDEICYQKGLQNGTIARILQNHGLSKNHDIFADSAEPKSIDEINTYGFSVQGVDKGADSILFGISILQECPFYVTRRSIHLIKELRQYCWDRDKTGAYLNKPVKINDHAIDAIRYIAMMLQANRKYTDETAPNEALLLALKIFN